MWTSVISAPLAVRFRASASASWPPWCSSIPTTTFSNISVPPSDLCSHGTSPTPAYHRGTAPPQLRVSTEPARRRAVGGVGAVGGAALSKRFDGVEWRRPREANDGLTRPGERGITATLVTGGVFVPTDLSGESGEMAGFSAPCWAARGADYEPIVATRIALIVCRRFSACSKTMLAGDSNTSLVTCLLYTS